MSDPSSTAVLMDIVLKGVIGGAIIIILGFFINQIVKGVWITRREYDSVVTMKDAIIADQKTKIEHLEAKLEKVEVTLRESASTMNQVIGAAVSKSGTNG